MAIGFEAFMFSQSRRKFTNKCFSTEREHINASHHLACHSVRVSAMVKKLSLQEVLDHITDQENSGSRFKVQGFFIFFSHDKLYRV